jgi:hypothetical protein
LPAKRKRSAFFATGRKPLRNSATLALDLARICEEYPLSERQEAILCLWLMAGIELAQGAVGDHERLLEAIARVARS